MTATSAVEGGNLSDKLIISAALTGSWPTKAQNPALPPASSVITGAADHPTTAHDTSPGIPTGG